MDTSPAPCGPSLGPTFCACCGAPVPPQKRRRGPPKRYCSEACRLRFNNQKSAERRDADFQQAGLTQQNRRSRMIPAATAHCLREAERKARDEFGFEPEQGCTTPWTEAEILADFFQIEPGTGLIFHAAPRQEWFSTKGYARRIAQRKCQPGWPADNTHDQYGYKRVALRAAPLFAHQVAFTLTHGRPQTEGLEVDHINRRRDDNRPANLREVTVSVNRRNRA